MQRIDGTTEAVEDGIRSMVHAMWASVAGHWAEHADYVDARGAELTRLMLERAGVTRGSTVLELACGPGSTGLAAAEITGPSGRVVVSDVAEPMVAIAGARAEARGLHHVEAAVLDAEAIGRPDASFDAVLCREGLMFAVRPWRAVAEMARVLRPGGHVSIAVWGPRAENPWLALVFDAVSAETGHPVPPPGVPGPFSLDEDDALRALVVDAGFVDVKLDRVAVPAIAATFDEWWTRTQAMAGPLANVLGQLPEAAQESIAARLRRATEPYATSAAIELPGLSLVVSGRRP